MHSFIHQLTQAIVTKKGAVICIAPWLIAVIVLSVLAPGVWSNATDSIAEPYSNDSPSIIAQKKADHYFGRDTDATENQSKMISEIPLLISQIKPAVLVLMAAMMLLLLGFAYRPLTFVCVPVISVVVIYTVTEKLLGIFSMIGMEITGQSLFIMILLQVSFVITYSMFIYSRYYEGTLALKHKYDALSGALKKVGVTCFYANSTIFLMMLALFITNFGYYKSLAIVLSVAAFIILLAALTLIPALFTLFIWLACWLKYPKANGIETENVLSAKPGHIASGKPILAAVVAIIFLLLAASPLFIMTYDYEHRESTNDNGATTPAAAVIFESDGPIGKAKRTDLANALAAHELVDSVELSAKTEDETIIQYHLTLMGDANDTNAMDALEQTMRHDRGVLADAGVFGELYFAGETAALIDSRYMNFRDLVMILLVVSMIILSCTIILTKSVKIAGIVIGTILLTFLATLGLGTVLCNLLFGITAINHQIPVYLFIFLSAFGVNWQFYLISRYMEEKKQLAVKYAVSLAVTRTFSIISLVAIIFFVLFSTYVVQSNKLLFNLGLFITIGILIDSFLIKRIFLPSLLVLTEKNEHIRLIKRRKMTD